MSGGLHPVTQQIQSIPAPQRFTFKIDANAPLKDLLPTPPAMIRPTAPMMTDDLDKVPEVMLQSRPEKTPTDGREPERIARQLANMNHLNAKKTDAFMTAILENREDLAGMPVAMGDRCRTIGERMAQFTRAVNTVRQALNPNQVQIVNFTFGLGGGMSGAGGPLALPAVPPVLNQTANQPVPAQEVAAPVAVATQPGGNAGGFWPQYTRLCEQEDAQLNRSDKALCEHVTLARIAALMQMLPAESREVRLGLVKYLTGVPHVESTRALAKLAIFSSEEEIRSAAIESLKVRREKDYTDILLNGLNYPWPMVAKRSAEAIARMGRADLIPELLTVLDSSDPRLPKTVQTADGKASATVRELVKVNHHRNCMLCHSPGSPETVAPSVLTAQVAVQGQPLPQSFQGYGQSLSPDLMIRVDVTYLRQDFSVMMHVPDAKPWPEMQRFDFLVRERKLTSEEATEYVAKLTPTEAGLLSPYHTAALAALRELTGKDTAPTGEAWRKLLKVKTAG
jgi:hypothetical protein